MFHYRAAIISLWTVHKLCWLASSRVMFFFLNTRTWCGLISRNYYRVFRYRWNKKTYVIPSPSFEHVTSWILNGQDTQYANRSMPVSKICLNEPETFCNSINQLLHGDSEINIEKFKPKIHKYDSNFVYGITGISWCR